MRKLTAIVLSALLAACAGVQRAPPISADQRLPITLVVPRRMDLQEPHVMACIFVPNEGEIVCIEEEEFIRQMQARAAARHQPDGI